MQIQFQQLLHKSGAVKWLVENMWRADWPERELDSAASDFINNISTPPDFAPIQRLLNSRDDEILQFQGLHILLVRHQDELRLLLFTSARAQTYLGVNLTGDSLTQLDEDGGFAWVEQQFRIGDEVLPVWAGDLMRAIAKRGDEGSSVGSGGGHGSGPELTPRLRGRAQSQEPGCAP